LVGIRPESGDSGGLMALDALAAWSVIAPFGSALRNHRGFRPFSVADGSFSTASLRLPGFLRNRKLSSTFGCQPLACNFSPSEACPLPGRWIVVDREFLPMI